MNRIRGRDPVAILSAQARPDQTELQQYIITSSERLSTWLNIYQLTRRRSKKSSRLQNTADHSRSYTSRIYIYIYETRLRQTRDILCKQTEPTRTIMTSVMANTALCRDSFWTDEETLPYSVELCHQGRTHTSGRRSPPRHQG